MEWTTHQDRIGFSVEHPTGWVVETLPGPTIIIRTSDRQSMVMIQPLRGVGSTSGAEIIQNGRFPGAVLFSGVTSIQAVPGPKNSTCGSFLYRTPNGAPGKASLTYFPSGDMAMLNVCACPENLALELEPGMLRILTSIRQGPAAQSESASQSASSSSASSPPPIPAPEQIHYTTFTDPQSGSFTMDVPQGWQTRGGLAHPMLGDRRMWVETGSPDRIYLLFGDPSFPESLCHFPGQPEGQLITLAAGGLFLNLKPSAQGVADFYLKQIFAKRFGPFQVMMRRPRPDVVEQVIQNVRRIGVTIDRSFQISALETMIQLGNDGPSPRLASVLAPVVFNGQYTMGMWAFWDAMMLMYVAPPGLIGKAEEVRRQMLATHRLTQRMVQIVQQDEAQIYANGQAANAAQWNWFAGQQAAHNAQVAAGDAQVAGYWQQQRSNDAMLRGWEQNQSVYDNISQNRHDAMMGNQRLADDGAGKQYEVAAGFDYYWRNQQTGEVIGTNTSTPPDYSNNYTQLRKM